MKKTPLLLVLLGCCAWSAHLAAQTVVNASVESEYRYEPGKNVRICVNPNDGATVIYYRDSIIGKNCFVYHKTAGTTSNKFVWPDIPEGTGYADCTVEDMKIIGDTLYFCGTATYPEGNVYMEKGYMGWMDADYLKNPTGAVGFNYYSSFEENDPFRRIVELSHLDGCFDTNDIDKVKIGLVGKALSTRADTTSCLLLVKKTSIGWYYQFHYLTDPKETFTDILFIREKMLVVPSRYEHEYEDHYRFGIRQEPITSAFSMVPSPLSGFQIAYRFNTRYMNTFTSVSPHPTWHRKDVEIHIIEDPVCFSCPGYATIAYECEDTAKQCETRQQTAIFKLDLFSSPDISIYAAQLVHGYFRAPYTFVDFHFVRSDTTIALLHRGVSVTGEMASIVLFPNWSHYGQIDGLLADYRSNTSLDVFKNQFIRLGGTALVDDDVIHYHLDKKYIHSSCYSTRPTFYTEELVIEYLPDQKKTDFMWCARTSLPWKYYVLICSTIRNIHSCESNNLSK